MPGCTISPGWCRWCCWLWLSRDHALVGSTWLGCWLALSILRIRTFLEHQAHERAGARSVIIEDRGPLSILFLNNNFHAVHHANPRLPWYRLPAEFARRRERVAGAERRLCLPLVWRGASRRHLLRRKDPVAHPIWTPPEPGAARRASGVGAATAAMNDGLAALPMYDWPEMRRRDRPALGGDPRSAAGGGGRGAGGADARASGSSRAGRIRSWCWGRPAGCRSCASWPAGWRWSARADYAAAGVSAGLVPQRGGGARGRSARARSPTSAGRGWRSTASTSQSGWGSILHHAAPLARDGRFFGAVVVSGAHVDSVVAGGRGRRRISRRSTSSAGGYAAAIRPEAAAAAGADADRSDAGAALHRGAGRASPRTAALAAHRRLRRGRAALGQSGSWR